MGPSRQIESWRLPPNDWMNLCMDLWLENSPESICTRASPSWLTGYCEGNSFTPTTIPSMPQEAARYSLKPQTAWYITPCSKWTNSGMSQWCNLASTPSSFTSCPLCVWEELLWGTGPMKTPVCLAAMIMKSTLIWNLTCLWVGIPQRHCRRMVSVLCFADRKKKIKGIGELSSSMGLADNECPKVGKFCWCTRCAFSSRTHPVILSCFPFLSCHITSHSRHLALWLASLEHPLKQPYLWVGFRRTFLDMDPRWRMSSEESPSYGM